MKWSRAKARRNRAHLRVQFLPLLLGEIGDLFFMALEHDQELSEEILVVVEPNLPQRRVIDDGCERRTAKRAQRGHAHCIKCNTVSSPHGL